MQLYRFFWKDITSTLKLQFQFSPVEVKVHILSSNMMPNFCRPIFMSVYDIQKGILLFQPFNWRNQSNFLTLRFNNSTTKLTILRKKKLVKRGRGKHVITRNLRSRNWTLLALKNETEIPKRAVLGENTEQRMELTPIWRWIIA